MSASASTQPKPMGDTDASIAADKPRVKLSTFCVAIGEAYTGFGDWVEAGVLRWVVAGVPGAEGTCNNRLIWERSVSACTSITAAVIVACCVLRASPARAHAPRPSPCHTLLHSPPRSAQRHTRENQRTRQHPVAEPYPHLTTLPHSAHARPLHPQISIGAPLCGQHTASRTRWCAPNLYASPICGDVVGLSSPPDGPTGRKCLRTAKEELQRVLGSLQTHVALHQQRAGDHLVRAGVESNVFRCLRGRWSSLHDACRHGQPIRILSVTERGGSVPCVRHRR